LRGSSVPYVAANTVEKKVKLVAGKAKGKVRAAARNLSVYSKIPEQG